MIRLPPALYNRLRETLIHCCNPLESNDALRTMFITSSLSPWLDNLPDTNSRTTRAETLIAYLFDQINAAGENALVVFLRELCERIDTADQCHTAVKAVLGDLELILLPFTFKNLCPPSPPRPFINREMERSALVNDLRVCRGKGDVFALVGLPGVGKTALAKQIASDVTLDFSGYVLWISLENAPSADTVWTQIANVFEMSVTNNSSVVARAALDRYCPLLILDNAENAPETALAIRNGCGAATVLLTSRDRIVASVDCNHPSKLLSPLSRKDAIAFLQYSRRSMNNGQCLATLDKICHSLGDLPLALELALGYMRCYDVEPEEYFDELCYLPLDEILSLDGTHLPSVQRSFDLSFNRLTENARLALKVLALDGGQSTGMEALIVGMRSVESQMGHKGEEARCAQRACNELVRHCLITKEKPFSDLRMGNETSRKLRFLLHPLVRRYAQEKMDRTEYKDIMQQLFNYYLAYVDTHNQATVEHYDAIEIEHFNVLKMLESAYLAERWDIVRRLARTLCRSGDGYLYVRGYWSEMQVRLKEAIHAAEIENQEQDAALFSCDLAALHYLTGDQEIARLEYETVLATFEKEKSLDVLTQARIAAVKHRLGLIAQNARDYEQAICYYQQSLTIYESLGDELNRAMLLHQLGRVAQDRKQYAEARQYYDQSLRIKQDIGDERGIADTLHQLGQLSKMAGDYVEARGYYEDCLRIAERFNDRAGMAEALGEIGRLMQDIGDYTKACSDYTKSLDIAERLGSVKIISVIRDNLVVLMEELANTSKIEGKIEHAEQLNLLMLAISQRLGNASTEMKALAYLIKLYTTQSRIDEARSLWRRVDEIAKQIS